MWVRTKILHLTWADIFMPIHKFLGNILLKQASSKMALWKMSIPSVNFINGDNRAFISIFQWGQYLKEKKEVWRDNETEREKKQHGSIMRGKSHIINMVELQATHKRRPASHPNSPPAERSEVKQFIHELQYSIRHYRHYFSTYTGTHLIKL